ncbi:MULTISPECIES: hypothetical protein [Stenotrophomonas]|uniref:hypothetical protein n=1 Tax=Stenotrophomonas TaxID=40323 RepID=UPI000872C4F3|nr:MULTISPECIES: hypothetical protein [Stenotrophomonas]OEZ01754.1 hypothetical protein BIY45_04770 [Stenotrophomonas sp. BIIR7]
MTALPGSLGLIGLTALLILILGGGVLSLSSRGRKQTGLELLAYAIGMGILALALIGVAVVSISWDYQRNSWLVIAVALAASLVQWVRTRVFSRLFGGQALAQAVPTRFVALGWVVMAALPMAVTFLPIKMPDTLPDGAYVIKGDNLHVRLQRMMGDFPADNYIPFVATEYLVRDISFAEERPLMPGQELANRPILMSLVAVPFRAAMDAPPKIEGPLPTFKYVGKQWPDVGRFGDDVSYRRFLAVALVLNASLFVGAALFFHYFGLRRAYSVAGLLLLLSSPYFLGQTLFAWPKSLAGFYLLLSAYTLLVRDRTWVAGLLAALAYWAHPYAVVFIGAFALYLLVRERNDMDPRRGLLPFCIAAVSGLLIWWGWAQWYLQMPSDLVEQNLGTQAALLSQAGIRLSNTLNTIAPISFTAWPSLHDLLQACLLGLVGGVGLLLLPQAVLGAVQCMRERRKEIVLLVALPSVLLVGVFSALAVPAVHGFQSVAVILLMLALLWMQRRGHSTLMMACVALQVSLNIALMVYRGFVLVQG